MGPLLPHQDQVHLGENLILASSQGRWKERKAVTRVTQVGGSRMGADPEAAPSEDKLPSMNLEDPSTTVGLFQQLNKNSDGCVFPVHAEICAGT